MILTNAIDLRVGTNTPNGGCVTTEGYFDFVSNTNFAISPAYGFGFAMVKDGATNGGGANSWTFQWIDTDAISHISEVSNTGGDWPWLVSWSSGRIVKKAGIQATVAIENSGFSVFYAYTPTGSYFSPTIISRAITGSKQLVKYGSGILTLSGANTYTGSTTIDAGTLQIASTGLLGNGSYSATVTNNGTFIFGSNSNQTLSGIISGTGVLTKNGTGTLTLSGNNTYSGGTTLNAGGININAATAIGNGTLTIVSGTLDNTSAAAITLTNNNAQNWNADFTFIGTKDLNMGTGAVTMNASRIVTVNAGNFTVGGNISGSTFGLTKNGSGTMILSGANTYNGTTTINTGTLKIGSTNGMSSASTLTVNGGAFNLNGFNATVAAVGVGNSAGTITNSAASGTNTLSITNYNVNLATLITDGATAKTAVTLSNNGGATVLSNANSTFSGGLILAYPGGGGGTRLYYQVSVTNTLSGTTLIKSNLGTGTIYIGANGSTSPAQLRLISGSIYNNIVVNAAIYPDGGLAAFRIDGTGIQFYGTMTAGSSNISLSSQSNGSATAYGQLSGTNGLLLKTPAVAGSIFTLTLANTANPTNNYSGDTTTSLRTTIALSAVNQIPNGTGKGNVVNNGSLTFGGLSHTINGLSGSGTIDGVSGTPILTVGNNNATSSFSGTIINTAGSLSLTKIGTGVLTLAGNNTYTGTTTISSGSIIVSKTTGTITGAATFTTTALTVNFNNVTPTTGATYQFFPGATSPTGLTITLTNAGGKTGTYNYTNSTLTIN